MLDEIQKWLNERQNKRIERENKRNIKNFAKIIKFQNESLTESECSRLAALADEKLQIINALDVKKEYDNENFSQIWDVYDLALQTSACLEELAHPLFVEYVENFLEFCNRNPQYAENFPEVIADSQEYVAKANILTAKNLRLLEAFLEKRNELDKLYELEEFYEIFEDFRPNKKAEPDEK